MKIYFILQAVAKEFEIEVVDLMPRTRNLQAIEARQTAMYVLWNTDGYTLIEIGLALDGRSASTVSYGYQKIARRITRNPRLRQKIDRIVAEIKEGRSEEL